MSKPLNDRAQASALDDYRITSTIEIFDLLRQVEASRTLVTLSSPEGHSYTTLIWNIEPDRELVGFSGESNHAGLRALLESNEVTAVAYLDSIKVQFDVHGLMLVHNGRSSAISCGYPREIFRFQRRNGYRVRPLLRNAPTARLRHPMIPDMQLNLRVLDVSIGGCALFLPEDVPMLEPGVLLNGVDLDLDADTHIVAPLRLQHVTSLHLEARGVRLGCELVNASNESLRALQRYIDQTQKRRRLMVLD